MALFGLAFKALAGFAKKKVASKVGRVIAGKSKTFNKAIGRGLGGITASGGLASPATLGAFTLGGIGARVLPAIGAAGRGIARGAGAAIGATRRFLNTPGGKWTKRAIRDLGLVVVGGLVFDQAGNLMGSVARRRMNPLNSRALRRAIRRVKSARGICRDVESMLPRRTVKAAVGKRCK